MRGEIGIGGGVDVGGQDGEAGGGDIAGEIGRAVVELVVADGHGLGADGVLDGELGHAVVGGVEEAALELIAGVEQENGAAVGFGSPALFPDGGGETGAASIAVGLWRGIAGHGFGVDGAVAGVEVVHVEDGEAVGRCGGWLGVGAADEGEGADGAEQDAAGEKHVWYPDRWGCVAAWHWPSLSKRRSDSRCSSKPKARRTRRR